MPAGEDVVRHERAGGGDHEAGADPQRVRDAPQRLPKRLRVPRDAHHPRLPQVQLRLIHRRHLDIHSLRCHGNFLVSN